MSLCRNFCAFLTRLLVLNLMLIVNANGAADADTKPPVSVGQASANLVSAPAKPIPDLEPQVTRQLHTLLLQYADGNLEVQVFTEKALALLPAKLRRENGARLASYGPLTSLQLLSRSVYGEDRRYRYRALYSGATLLVEINFNKGGKLDYLQITPE
jgi:hypothetical protein